MALPISNLARNNVLGFLNNLFNSTLADNCATFSAVPFTLDFSTNSRNFFQGYYSSKDLVGTSIVKFPIMTLYTHGSANQNITKFNVFSGLVQIGIDTYLSFPQSAALSNTESLGDAVESTMYTMFNAPDNQPLWATPYYSLTYMFDASVRRGAVSMGAQNWIQLIQTQFSIKVDASVPFEII